MNRMPTITITSSLLNKDVELQQTETHLRPVSPDERILALDVVRGFALLGVLIAYALWNLGSPPEQTYSQADRILNVALTVLVDAKCYTLFAIMFGLGFGIQLTRASARGISIAPTYRRRLLVLLLIGLAHALLLRNGDILVPYAVIGFLLLAFRNSSNKTLALGAIIGLVFPYLARIAWGITGIPFPQRPATDGMSYFTSNLVWVRYWYENAITIWPGSMPMFLFGLYLGRRRVLEDIAAHRKSFRIALLAGLALGVLSLAGAFAVRAWATSVHPYVLGLTLLLLTSAHAWGLAAFYGCSLILLVQRPGWLRLFAPVGAVGRMALTNYLLQSVLIVPVCIVFGLFDRINPTIGVVLALGVWAIQVPASVWWLRHFEFGPAEWLWRSLTYGRPQQMRTDFGLPQLLPSERSEA